MLTRLLAFRYGPVEANNESAINILIDVVRAQKKVNMDHWSTRYPTHVQDVARVLVDVGALCGSSRKLGPGGILICFSRSQFAGHHPAYYSTLLVSEQGVYEA